MGRWKVRRTTLICFGCSGFLAGLVVGRFYWFGWAALVVVFAFAPLLFRRNILSLLSITIIGLLLGCWRGATFRLQLFPYSAYAHKKIVLQVVAKTDAVYGQRKELKFDAVQVQIIEPRYVALPGTISVGLYGLPAVYAGDQLTIVGRLYPTRGARVASVGFASVVKVKRSHSVVARVRRSFANGVQTALPEPHGSFTLGLLVGQRTTLPTDLLNDLSVTGLTHIVAVSGYNVTILVQFVHRLLKKRSKYQASLVTLLVIISFVLLCGTSASIVRAGLISTMSLGAWYYGRMIRPVLLILLTAAVTAGWSPIYIWSDIGWHLSFMAFAGVLLVAPVLEARLESWPVPDMVVETVAAIVMTTPLILFVFGKLSVVALLANLLIVPFVPLAMMLGLLAGLAGMIVPAFAGWVAWPVRLVMTYMLDVIGAVARLPSAAVGVRLSGLQMTLVYAGILVLALGWRKALENSRIQIRKQE